MLKIDFLLADINKKMSTYDKSSEISKFNNYEKTVLIPRYLWAQGMNPDGLLATPNQNVGQVQYFEQVI